MKITAVDLLRAGVIHRIIYEPIGGAHRDHAETIRRIALALDGELKTLSALMPSQIRRDRHDFFGQLGRTERN